jgi:branched-chain amino acid transport system substrate-binding protein
MLKYPDHAYYQDAKSLVDSIQDSLFKSDTIGILLPLTGKYAVFGQRALTGISLAIQQLSEKYSKKFNTIIIDTKATPALAVEGVRQLHKKNVAGIIGPLLTVNEAGKKAQELKIPMIALTQKGDFPLQGDYLFSNFITPEMQVRTLGAHLFLKLGIKKAAILYPDEKYGKKYRDLFWDVADEYGAQIVGVESYDGKNTDFAEPIKKLTGQFYPVPEFLKTAAEIENEQLNNLENMESDRLNGKSRRKKEEKVQIDFEALFIPDSPSKINLILPQLTFNDAKGMYLAGTNLWHHKSILKHSKGYNKKVVITDGFFDNSQNAATLEFTEKFKLLYNKAPKFLEAALYDNVIILFSTAMDETIDSREKLKEALKGSRIYEGATGNTIFDKDGTAHKELFLLTIEKDKFVEIKR